jgi:xeroderma pigmentosum group C-complementing protein
VEEDEPRPEVVTYDLEMMDEDQDMPIESISNPPRAGTNGMPKTMREMAEAAAAQMHAKDDLVDKEGRPSPKARSGVNDTATDRAMNTPPNTTTRRSTRASGTRKRKNDEEGDADTPTKKGRGGNGGTVTPSPGSSTRVLRPRALKSAAQVKEEKAKEEAYRKAIEG